MLDVIYLLIGWVAGMATGFFLAWGPTIWTPVWPTPLGFSVYIGLFAVAIHALVSVTLSFLLPNDGTDETKPADFEDSPALVKRANLHEPEPIL